MITFRKTAVIALLLLTGALGAATLQAQSGGMMGQGSGGMMGQGSGGMLEQGSSGMMGMMAQMGKMMEQCNNLMEKHMDTQGEATQTPGKS